MTSSNDPRKSDYSLWLAPTAEEAVFSDLIQDLSTRSTPNTIPFAPHATLLPSSIIGPTMSLDEITSRTKQAVARVSDRVKSVTCRFGHVEAGNLFFQCVYIRLLKHESPGLMDVHRALLRAFKQETDLLGDTYFPHMSLVYGDLDADAKQGLIDGLLARGEAQDVQGASGRQSVAGFTEFSSSSILIVKTAGRSDEWQIEATVNLSDDDKTFSHEEL